MDMIINSGFGVPYFHRSEQEWDDARQKISARSNNHQDRNKKPVQ
jgi:hypothetical protein